MTRGRTAERGDTLAPLLRLARDERPVPVEAAGRVASAVDAEWRAGVLRRRRRRGGIAAACAVALGLVAVGLLGPTGLWRLGGGNEARLVRSIGTLRLVAAPGETPAEAGAQRITEQIAPGSVLETTPSGRARIELPGTEEVRVAGETRLAYLGPRHLRLDRGRIYFDSHRAPEAGRSILPSVVVETPYGPVRNLGTRYEIRVAGDRLEIAVRSGSVERVAADGTVTRISAGRLSWLGADGDSGERAVAPTAERWRWTSDLSEPFATEGRTLADLLSWVEDETGLETRWQAPGDPEAIALRGDLVARDPLRAAEVALRMSGLGYQEHDGVLWVTPARAAAPQATSGPSTLN